MKRYAFLVIMIAALLIFSGCNKATIQPEGAEPLNPPAQPEAEVQSDDMPKVPEEWEGKTIAEIMNQSSEDENEETIEDEEAVEDENEETAEDEETADSPPLPEGTTIVEARKTETGMVFFPLEIKISVGETVRFVNALDYINKQAELTFYSYLTGVFRSPELKYGEYFEHTFDETGNFTYNAIPYQSWFKKGTIVVVE